MMKKKTLIVLESFKKMKILYLYWILNLLRINLKKLLFMRRMIQFKLLLIFVICMVSIYIYYKNEINLFFIDLDDQKKLRLLSVIEI
jgi:hypothetical protein